MSARDLLRRNDERFLAVAEGLSAADWSRPSLCSSWSNHEVLAHLVIGYGSGPGLIASEIQRSGWSFDRANAEVARTLARSRTPRQLLAEFEAFTIRPRGLGRYFPRRLLIGDHVTHELDIVLALGREPSIPAESLIAVLNTQVAVPNPFVPAFRNSRGLRLVADDVDWAHGPRGAVVEGRAAHLVSVLGSRSRMLSGLRGDGVEVLASRVSPHPTRRAG